jgi:hypothetical protein
LVQSAQQVGHRVNPFFNVVRQALRKSAHPDGAARGEAHTIPMDKREQGVLDWNVVARAVV